MDYRIVADSCCEFPDEFKKEVPCVNVPLTIMVEDMTIVDDETFDQKVLLMALRDSKEGARSACPSPEAYMRAYEGEEEEVYVITISADLSGSYNAAMLAKDLFEESHGDKKIHVFNSESTSGGETLVALLIRELKAAGRTFEEVVEAAEAFIRGQRTYFVLESLEELRKNGRLSNLKALAANTLNLKPVCAGDHGSIIQLTLARGIKKALKKMVEITLKDADMTPGGTKDKILIINHCNCPERAQEVLADFVAKAEFRETLIMDTAGINSLYAEDGGIIVTL